MKRAFVVTLLSVVVLLFASVAGGRPGGGQSFRSSSSSSSSGGSRSSSSSSSSSGGYRSSSSSSSSSSGGYRSTSSSSSSTSSSSSGGYRSTSSSTSSSSSSGWTSTSSTSSSGYTSTSSSSSSGYDPTSTSSPYTPAAYEAPQPSLFKRFVTFVFVAAFIVAAVVLVGRWRASQQQSSWDAAAVAEERARRYASIQDALAAIRSADDAFSFVLFEDFLYALYAEVHTARGKKTLGQLGAYLSPEASAAVGANAASSVDAIVIGGMRMESITTNANGVQLDVVFTTNLSEKDPSGAPAAFYMEERWTLLRGADAKSRPPERARVIGCPSCGAPLDKSIGAKCGYCGAVTSGGAADWYVASVEVLSREPRGPMLTGTTEEVGTDWPTVVAPDARAQMDALRGRDQEFTWAAFVGRVNVVFAAFHRSWSAQDLTAVRPYLSDNLYELQRYWVHAYKEQGLRNVTESPRIITVHLAKVTHDRYFDAVTVRVFASCVDYTVDGSGSVVGGDKSKVREYTEYWTFIRGTGKTGAPRADGACPSCGAPLADVNMAGKCGHCGAKVSSGEFDWVLSRIEQDEVYSSVA